LFFVDFEVSFVVKKLFYTKQLSQTNHAGKQRLKRDYEKQRGKENSETTNCSVFAFLAPL